MSSHTPCASLQRFGEASRGQEGVFFRRAAVPLGVECGVLPSLSAVALFLQPAELTNLLQAVLKIGCEHHPPAPPAEQWHSTRGCCLFPRLLGCPELWTRWREGWSFQEERASPRSWDRAHSDQALHCPKALSPLLVLEK